jgi:hypothetical protein
MEKEIMMLIINLTWYYQKRNLFYSSYIIHFGIQSEETANKNGKEYIVIVVWLWL